MAGGRDGDVSLLLGLGRAVGTMLGLHLQYAQREAAADLGRVVVGAVLLVLTLLLVGVALLLGHAALVLYLVDTTPLGPIQATLSVAGGDLALALLFGLVAKSRLSRPVLGQTRSLVRRTVESFASSGASS